MIEQQTIEVLKSIRRNFRNHIEQHTLEELNRIPNGFNNNIIWNIAHAIATQQLLVYGLSKTPMHVSNAFIEKYRKGTKPEGDVTKDEVDQINSLLFDTIDHFIEDLSNNVFGETKTYETSFGYTVERLEGAVEFSNTHEGLHLGYINCIRKFL